MAQDALHALDFSPNYAALLSSLQERICSTQARAALAVNREVVLLCWQIGREIFIQQGAQRWDARVIDRLSQDLRQAFPDMKGFSARNLKYMRAFADAWPDEQFVQQVVAQLREKNRVIVEYALRDLSKPIGVSAYQLTRALPEGLKGSLPTIEELEAELTPDSQAG